MKRIMVVTAALAAAFVLSGCGARPKIPAKAVAAGYVDVRKVLVNVQGVIEAGIDEIADKDLRAKAEREYKDFLSENKKKIEALDPQWALVLACAGDRADKSTGAVVLRCNCTANVDGMTVGAFLSGMLTREIEIAGCKAFRGYTDFGRMYAAIAGDAYVIMSDDENTLRTLIELYKNGNGDTSDDFCDLADLDSDAVARFQTAQVKTVAKMLGVTEKIEKFGKDCDDEEIADMLLDFSNVTLDLNLSESKVGLKLAVDAGTKDLAKLIEGVFNIAAFAARVGTDGGVGFAKEFESYAGADGAKALRASADLVRDAVESDRDGTVATIELALDTDDLLEAIVPAMTGK